MKNLNPDFKDHEMEPLLSEYTNLIQGYYIGSSQAIERYEVD